MERPPPPVTVSVPGGDGTPAELLDAGPPPASRVPSRLRAVALVGVLALMAGLAVAYGRSTAPPPPPPVLPLPVPVAGVTANADLVDVREQEHVQRVLLSVRLAPATGRGDSGGSPDGGAVSLLGVTARGFDVQVEGAPLPVVLGDPGRRGSGSVESTGLAADVVVTDCAVEAQAPRRIVLQVRRGDGPVGAVPAVASPDVVRALDRLVSRTCRRPRG